MPYARPPVGDLRWRKPQELPEDYDWSNVKGDKYGNLTAQPTYDIRKWVRGGLGACHPPRR